MERDELILQYGDARESQRWTWHDVTNILNEELGASQSESAYRKRYKTLLQRRLEDMQEDDAVEVDDEPKIVYHSSTMTEFELKKLEMEKERRKLGDQRVEMNRLIREQARRESFLEQVRNVICSEVEPLNLNIHYDTYDSKCDILCSVSDIHAGLEIESPYNIFNENVLKERFEHYTSQILDIGGFHEAENCYLVIGGDCVSGLIHNTLRLQNNMDLMESFKYVCELITAMVCKLAPRFSSVKIINVIGNHGRVNAKKEDSLTKESMDLLVPFYLRARLQNITNVTIVDNDDEPTEAFFKVRNSLVYTTHGDADTPKNVLQHVLLVHNQRPDICLLSHRHTNGLLTEYDTKILQAGCFSGTGDDYTKRLRLSNKAEQVAAIIDDKGLLCFYDIQI